MTEGSLIPRDTHLNTKTEGIGAAVREQDPEPWSAGTEPASDDVADEASAENGHRDPAEHAEHADHAEHHVLRDASDPDRWAWRRAIRQRPAALAVYRGVVFFIGTVLVVGGLIMVPLPGPGWLVVILGLAVLASEFERAQRVLHFVRDTVRRWEGWVRAQPWYVGAFLGLLTCAFVLSVVWLSLYVSGVPRWLPDVIEIPLHDWARLPYR